MNVYIHIPFCKSKCPYCAFVSGFDIKLEDQYVKAVIKEISSRGTLNMKGESVYFGGGTPSMLSIIGLKTILDHLKNRFSLSPDCEITIEVNPDDLNEEKSKNWLKLGVNRISVGVQSLNNLGHLIGRIYTKI